MTVVAITGGRDRWLTLAELEQLDAVLFGTRYIEPYKRTLATVEAVGLEPGVVRHGDARGADKQAAAYLRARTQVDIEAWPADWTGLGTAAGPHRNGTMLRGENEQGQRPVATHLVSFDGGRGTANCRETAEAMGVPVVRIHACEEPRPWNRHHGKPTVTTVSRELAPTLYCGHGTPVGNPFRSEVRGLRGAARAAAAGDVLESYRWWLWARINPTSPDFDRAVVQYIHRLTPDHFAVCSCWPAHCHVEVVIAAWRWLTRMDNLLAE